MFSHESMYDTLVLSPSFVSRWSGVRGLVLRVGRSAIPDTSSGTSGQGCAGSLLGDTGAELLRTESTQDLGDVGVEKIW